MIVKHSNLRWFVTPDKLREMADKLQLLYNNANCGDNITIMAESNSDCDLIIVADQENMSKESI